MKQLYFKMDNFSEISSAIFSQEIDSIENLLKDVYLPPEMLSKIQANARHWVEKVRSAKTGAIVDYFLTIHQLNSPKGITLMALAESLLRIPDSATADRLIADKLNLNPLLAAMGLPIAKKGVSLVGERFILGKDIQSALKRAQKPYRYSFDMLGEAAKTAQDAQRYFESYKHTIHEIGKTASGGPILAPGISVKLSALHPRYQYTQVERLQKELVPKLIELASLAKQYNISLTVDAEEAERLQLSLILIEQTLASSELNNWDGFGMAVQAYQKAAPAVLDVCAQWAKQYKHRLLIRLVKGAYWDSEIKRAQELGLAHYPVYTRKVSTDVSYLVCAQQLFKNRDAFYPQFATHNAFTIAAILEMAGQSRDFEFQRLQGMGENLYQTVMEQEAIACRIYAPVGDYQHLLAYLVRRLLENGANTSFVHQVEDKDIPVEQLIANPIEKLAALSDKVNPKIPLPKDIYGVQRLNPIGYDLSDFATAQHCEEALSLRVQRGNPDSDAQLDIEPGLPRCARNDRASLTARPDGGIIPTADKAFFDWSSQKVKQRAEYLYKASDLFIKHQLEFMSLLVQEGKKTIPDAQSEVREAIDYCRYYALCAEKIMTQAEILPGPTGERNELTLHGRGIAVCISPWNFPLAIFLGQIVAALVTGNTVIAKPSSLTPRIAMRAVEVLHQAGIPKEVLQLVIGKSSEIGDTLIEDPRVALVIFTGSTSTAQHINRTLAARDAPLASFIAETGGQNAMIVDSSALIEQVVTDVITSAFNSAGQRCSALRILCVQEEIYSPLIAMLKGAMAELVVGDSSLLATDLGPVIDANAQTELLNYIKNMQAQVLYQTPITATGAYVPPTLIEIKDIRTLTKEVFGPVLHVVSYKRKQLPELLQALNATGYGLTLGIHSRIESFAKEVVDQTFVGNNYINRNMIGAVVGVQPFGGQRLSGTGPKAGGPHYLLRMVTEKTITTNTAALGGNVTLLGLEDDTGSH